VLRLPEFHLAPPCPTWRLLAWRVVRVCATVALGIAAAQARAQEQAQAQAQAQHPQAVAEAPGSMVGPAAPMGAASAAASAADSVATGGVDHSVSPRPQGRRGGRHAPAAASAPGAAASGTDAQAPVELTAEQIRSELDGSTLATGHVDLRRLDLKLTSDSLDYNDPSGQAVARGQVVLRRGDDRFAGPELHLQIDTEVGYMLDADYRLAATQAGGHAARVDFTGSHLLTAEQADYSSCKPDGSGQPDWILKADKLTVNNDTHEGRAEGAVLHFLGVPILVLPSMTFPTDNARKSGWLPPSINIDSRSGFEFLEPYYWNIAPNMDATLTPGILVKRGATLEGEFRYLQPNAQGQFSGMVLPDDKVAGRSRYALDFNHDGQLDADTHYSAEWQQVSDDAYWKDFPRILPSLTPRLLPLDLRGQRNWALGDATLSLYARVERWQVLQDPASAIDPPYQRSPQIGLRVAGQGWWGLDYRLETEADRFDLRDRAAPDTRPLLLPDTRPNGSRLDALGSVSKRFEGSWYWIEPRASFNAASYHTDDVFNGRTQASRFIPTFTLDTGLRMERDTTLFGHDLRQTLEPRLFYVNTPFRDQGLLPNFDAAAQDFNFDSIYSPNAFSGVDRVSDANQVTAGATTRWLDRSTGAELLRLGAAQTFLFSDQRLTPSGEPNTAHFSDLLLYGSGTLFPKWTFDATMQYNVDQGETSRTILSVRYHPAPFYTLSGTYRYSRTPIVTVPNQSSAPSEQYELAWQWPVYRSAGARASIGSAGSCGGTLYGVGRTNYSAPDHRLIDSILGLEYDAGCWIGRLVTERVSTGATQSNTRIMLQLELTGLSRLGSNPLKLLKDNIPGYRLLRDDSTPLSPTSNSAP
jgi:LPS-assembly protein